jgi:Cys-rich protein (TIGR01571 family)
MFQSRYDQQAVYVVPTSQDTHTTQTHQPTSENTTSAVPIAYATPLLYPDNNPHTTTVATAYTQPPHTNRLPLSSFELPTTTHFQQPRTGSGSTPSYRTTRSEVVLTESRLASLPWMSIRPSRQHNNTNSTTTLARWHDTLFSCWLQLYPSCFCSFFCPCFLIGDITAKIKYMPFICSFSVYLVLYAATIYLLITAGGGAGTLLLWLFLSLFVCSIRKKIRIQDNFRHGNDIEDCANSCCCMCCTISQMARHVFRYSSTIECKYKLTFNEDSPNINTNSNYPNSISRNTQNENIIRNNNRIPGIRGRSSARLHTTSNSSSGSNSIGGGMSNGTSETTLPRANVTAGPATTHPTVANVQIVPHDWGADDVHVQPLHTQHQQPLHINQQQTINVQPSITYGSPLIV